MFRPHYHNQHSMLSTGDPRGSAGGVVSGNIACGGYHRTYSENGRRLEHRPGVQGAAIYQAGVTCGCNSAPVFNSLPSLNINLSFPFRQEGAAGRRNGDGPGVRRKGLYNEIAQRYSSSAPVFKEVSTLHTAFFPTCAERVAGNGNAGLGTDRPAWLEEAAGRRRCDGSGVRGYGLYTCCVHVYGRPAPVFYAYIPGTDTDSLAPKLCRGGRGALAGASGRRFCALGSLRALNYTRVRTTPTSPLEWGDASPFLCPYPFLFSWRADRIRSFVIGWVTAVRSVSPFIWPRGADS